MLRAVNNPTLVLIAAGQPRTTYPLAGGVTTIGRAPENIVVLNDASVSRRHAEIEVSPDRVMLRDNHSRNGVQVNGVPRREAVLTPGDRLHIGKLELQFTAGLVRSNPPVPAKPGDPAALAETRQHRAALPDQQQDRHLAALYHLCFRATESAGQGDAEQQLLELLLDALRSKLAQYYTADCKLAFTAAEEKVRTTPKFAPYLLEKFQQLPESAAYTPADLARFQQKLGDWHFLVAPLRPAGGSPDEAVPVVVLLRPADWQEFSASDRTLLNAAARLWPRSRSTGGAPAKAAAPATGSTATPGLMGDSPVMQALRTRLDRIAATKATALITGETGSGKEVVAQYLHDHSPRAKAPFIKVNCAAIPAALMESELFGHAKGAFTDARSDRQGKFQLAHGGTIFLDEIGELPLPVQSKLLRVLESGEVEKLGSERATKVDVRILAATNRDLRAETKGGTFREDLLYRLEVASAPVPPLREHAADIPELARHFLKVFCVENGLIPPELEPTALAALQKHPWPGNVRELRNVIQRLAMDADGPALTATAVQRALN